MYADIWKIWEKKTIIYLDPKTLPYNAAIFCSCFVISTTVYKLMMHQHTDGKKLSNYLWSPEIRRLHNQAVISIYSICANTFIIVYKENKEESIHSMNK